MKKDFLSQNHASAYSFSKNQNSQKEKTFSFREVEIILYNMFSNTPKVLHCMFCH